MMWRAENADGGLLYPSFVETVVELRFLYWGRLVGGLLYISGFVMRAWNLVATARRGKAVDGQVEVPRRERPLERVAEPGWRAMVLDTPVVVSVLVLGLLTAVVLTNPLASLTFLFVAVFLVIGALLAAHLGGDPARKGWHSLLEGKALLLTVLSTLAVVAGGVAEIVPSVIAGASALRTTTTRPYTALELEGRDVYLREGCYTCHSQMVRPFTWETARFGDVSSPDESVFDHPFQWGSRRIGPDLARLAGRYSDDWHYQHMMDPRAVTPGSIMPPYPHLVDEMVDLDATSGKLRAMFAIGVPYTAAEIEGARADAERQAAGITAGLRQRAAIEVPAGSRMVALIAYLQRLGAAPPAPTPPTAPTAPTAPTPPTAEGVAR
jgi:cytochrome c oxidase cbb3-type subunit I/II